MKVIRFIEGRWYSNILYNFTNYLLFLGRKYFFKTFYRQEIVDGHIIFMDRWVTQREMDTATKRADELLQNIKWVD